VHCTDLPLSLYIHYPWCLKKCPYCDFNSHARTKAGSLDDAYVEALLCDLEGQYQDQPRPVQTIFIGGGTPSLLSGQLVARLLSSIRELVDLAPEAEISLEANPGAVDAASFAAYRAAGVNRLSIGVQSLNDVSLRAIGRVHDRSEAEQAVRLARAAGFANLNLDLMFGLPGQRSADALCDLAEVIDLGPDHLSWYQLTLEPHTAFYQAPPVLPEDDEVAQMQDAGFKLLAQAGFDQYEVSAYARPGHQCRHNLNYWRFGDYLGIGAGAHAKLTLASGEVMRLAKPRGPERYLADPLAFATESRLEQPELVLEFMLNALRLRQGVDMELFVERTGLDASVIAKDVAMARSFGLLDENPQRLRATEFGYRFLNDLVGCFMED
jgi:oxygen-independent coproporphyrinogen-3 oxidase